jgi:transcriptional regulator with XRE-family HTH domain
MTLGKKLALQRKANGLSQEEVALKIRVNTQTVTDWENNIGEPSIQNLKDLSALFEISIDDLLDTGMGDDDVAIGYCKNCGIAINERNLGEKEPVVLCRRCVEVNKAQKRREEMKQNALRERQEKAHRARVMAEYSAFKDRQKTIRKKKAKSFIVAAIPTLLWIVFMVYTQMQAFDQTEAILGGVVAYCIFSFVALLFYDGPVRDLLVYMCTASIKWPGLVSTFDKDGFLWVIAIKSLFVVISFIFGLLCGILGIALGLVISPFVFPYKLIKMSYDIRHADLTDYVS